MSTAVRNTSSAGSRNSISEEVPLTTITPTRDIDDGSGQERRRRTQNTLPTNKNGDVEKNSTDGVADSYNPEVALANNPILSEVPEGFNVYRNKKTLTQGLMDIALFSANANQLRYIFDHGATNKPFFYIAASLIIISLILQIGVGLLLLISTQYSINVECQRQIAYKYGNYVVVGIFLITVVNIFIAAFGGPAVVFPAAVASSLPSASIISNTTVGT